MKFGTIRCALAFCHNDIAYTAQKINTPKLDVQHDKHILILCPRFYFLSFALSLFLSRIILQMWHLHTHSIRFKDFQFNPSTYLYVYRQYKQNKNEHQSCVERSAELNECKKDTGPKYDICIYHLFFFFFLCVFCFAFVLIFNLFFIFFLASPKWISIVLSL